MNRSMLRSLQIPLLVVFAGWTNSLPASDWRVGDVFVGIGNGKYEVYDKDGNFKVEATSDGQDGMTGGCAFDSTYHLVTTNVSKAMVFRYKIDDPHGRLQTISLRSPSSPTGGAGSIVFASNGDFYVGSPGSPGGDGFIRKYRSLRNRDDTGTLLATYPVAVENSGSNWIDLAAVTTDEEGQPIQPIFYTSEGRQIKRFDVLNNRQMDDFVNLGNAGGPNVGLFALRLLPDGGLLVADKRNIKRLNSVGTVVKEYDASGQDDWRSLNLDSDQNFFWAGDATSGRFYRFNIATGVKLQRSIQSGQLSGICVNGAFSEAQGSPHRFEDVLFTSADPSETFRFPPPNGPNKLTVTLNNLMGSVTLNASAAFIHKDAGFSDNGMACTTTAATGDQCVVWNIDANPQLQFPETADLKILQLNTDMDTRVLKNEATDFTTFVRPDIDPGGRTRTFSVFSLNQASVIGNAVSCGLQNLSDGSVVNAGANIAFRFQAAVVNGAGFFDCKNGPFRTNLQPRLLAVRVVEGRVPETLEAKAIGISNNFPRYSLVADGKTYGLNVKLPAGQILLTTIDDSLQIPAFDVLVTSR